MYAQWNYKVEVHTHVWTARSAASNMRIVYKGNTWPWTIVGTSRYGCSTVNKANPNTCIADNQTSDGLWKAYYVTCKFCGESNGTNVWCPVHDGGSQAYGGGGAYREICDATTKKYSSDTCERGAGEGWTKVSKSGN